MGFYGVFMVFYGVLRGFIGFFDGSYIVLWDCQYVFRGVFLRGFYRCFYVFDIMIHVKYGDGELMVRIRNSDEMTWYSNGIIVP